MLKRNNVALGIEVFAILLVVLAAFSGFVVGEGVPSKVQGGDSGESAWVDDGSIVIPIEEIVDDSEEVNLEDEDLYVPLEKVVGETGDVELAVEESDKEEVEEDGQTNEEVEGIGDVELAVEESIEEENDFEFVDLEDIVPGEEVEEDDKPISLQKDAKKELGLESSNGPKITKEKNIIEEDGEWVKQVTVQSDDHYDRPLVVYEDIIESEEWDIYVYWVSNESFIDFETYDDNENGLIDRISWVVPHLSKQVFEIMVNFDLEDSENVTDTIVIERNVPEGVVSESPVSFGFNVSYFNSSALNCDFSLKFGSEEVVNGTESSYNVWLENEGNYDWEFSCYDENNNTISNTDLGNFSVEFDFTADISFSVDDATINEGEGVTFDIDVNLGSVMANITYTLNYGDGSSNYVYSVYSNKTSSDLFHQYNAAGNYAARLNVDVEGTTYVRERNITVNEINDEDNEDTEKPSVTLVEPDDNDIISTDEILFVYKASDNVKVENCTFSLFYFDDDSGIGTEVYSVVNKSITHGKNTEIKMHNFDEGDYNWDVECYDNSSNKSSAERDFEYVSSDSSGSSTSASALKSAKNVNDADLIMIGELINSINDFLVAEEKYSAEEREAVEDLGLIDELKFYKKRLLQMELDLQHNLDYVIGEDRRAERRKEIVDEAGEMRSKISVSIRVVSSSEYFKNSLDIDLEEVMRAYADAKGLVLDEKRIREMARQNELLQNQITISVRAKHIEMEYLEGEDDFTLVTKEIVVKEGNFDSYIEVIPKEVAESASSVSFVQEARVLKDDPIFEIDKEDVEGMIVYMIDGFVKLNEIEKTSTISFKENVPLEKIGGVTGFVSFVGGGDNRIMFYVSWIIAIILVVFIATYSVRNVRVRKLKKIHEVKELFEISNEIEGYLKQKDVDSARERYLEAQAIYQSIPENGKKVVYKKLEKLFQQIDRKDMGSLIKEFMSAAKEGRKEDALMIYGNIQAIYPRMSVRLQQKVYDKINPLVRKMQREG